VRGFAAKFCTDEGIFDLVGNNIPVFFIHVPDLIHSVKMEADRGYPQDATVHDTFWDFISLLPESMNMVLWIMSDRTIPRSSRVMGSHRQVARPLSTSQNGARSTPLVRRSRAPRTAENRQKSSPKRAFQNISVIGAAKCRWVAACEARRVP